MPKVKKFYPSRASRREPLGRTTGSNDHLTEDGEEVAQFCFENEDDDEDDDEYDDKSDAYGIVNPTRPRTRPR
jgi:hypothetical protein